MNDFISTPFAIVVGTVSDNPSMVELCRRKGDEIIGYWRKWQNQEPRVFLDTELHDEDAKRFSLWLVGGPDSNAVAARVVEQLPLRVRRDGLLIGDRLFNVGDAGVQMIYPSPFNRQRYVRIAATTPQGMLFLDPLNYDLGFWDFTITDRASPGTADPPMPALLGVGARPPAYELAVALGMFDYKWQTKDEFLILGNEALLRKVLR